MKKDWIEWHKKQKDGDSDFNNSEWFATALKAEIAERLPSPTGKQGCVGFIEDDDRWNDCIKATKESLEI